MEAGRSSLAGKVIVVGGGAGGSGEAISTRLAEGGAHVVVGDIAYEAAEALAERLQQRGLSASPCLFDIADRESVRAMVEAAGKEYLRLDGVHMIAGNPAVMLADADLLSIDFNTWQSQINAHLFAYAAAARSAIPLMEKVGGGSIVFTSSASCRSADITRIGYQTAKSAMETMTRHVAHRYGKIGVRCNTLAYGVVLTEKARAFLPPAFIEDAEETTWMPRLGRPADLAGIAALLHSADGEWITGQIIDVNGGLLLRG